MKPKMHWCYWHGYVDPPCEHMAPLKLQQPADEFVGNTGEVDAEGGQFLGYAEEEIHYGDTVVLNTKTGYLRRYRT